MFSNYVEVSGKHVFLADDKKCNVDGIGDVILKFEIGFNITLKHVKHVPDLTYNLMSCSALEDEGLEGRWGKGVMKILKGSLVVFKSC